MEMPDEIAKLCDHYLERGGYYVHLEKTGNLSIDRIAGAINLACKYFHHTSDWWTEVSSIGDKGVADVIQMALNDAADHDSQLRRELADELEAAILKDISQQGMKWTLANKLLRYLRSGESK